MKRLWTAGLALVVFAALTGGARAQLDLSGAVPPSQPGATTLAPPPDSDEPTPGAPRSLGEPRKMDKTDKLDVDFNISLASTVGRPLRLNGKDGQLTLWGRDKALKIAKLTLQGEVISDPAQKCKIDIVGDGPIEAKSLGRPDGLARYEAEIPACPFAFDVVEGGVLVPPQNSACAFQAADCRASPSGLWGTEGSAAAGEAKDIASQRAHAEDVATRILKMAKVKFKGRPELDGIEREQAALAARSGEICLDYDRESEHGFCASRMAEARAALLKARAERLARGEKAQD